MFYFGSPGNIRTQDDITTEEVGRRMGADFFFPDRVEVLNTNVNMFKANFFGCFEVLMGRTQRR